MKNLKQKLGKLGVIILLGATGLGVVGCSDDTVVIKGNFRNKYGVRIREIRGPGSRNKDRIRLTLVDSTRGYFLASWQETGSSIGWNLFPMHDLHKGTHPLQRYANSDSLDLIYKTIMGEEKYLILKNKEQLWYEKRDSSFYEEFKIRR